MQDVRSGALGSPSDAESESELEVPEVEVWPLQAVVRGELGVGIRISGHQVR